MTEQRPERRDSATTQIRIIESITGLVSRIVVGLLFMAGGGWTIWWGLHHEDHTILVGGVVAAVFGAMVLPSIFDSVKPVVVFFFPNGLPIFGGRRTSDPPPRE